MQTSDFLKAVLGDEGWYCVFAAKDGTLKQKFYEKPEYLLKVASQMDQNELNTYFALATFIDADSRKADNAHQLKSFFVDLDCGTNKEYANKKEALQALVTFCKNRRLSKPIIVDSGNGLHAYWPLSEAVSVSEWLPVASKLKKVCMEDGLRIDPAVTADVARVLRLPGTRNFKNGVPRDVSIVSPSNASIDLGTFAERIGFVDGETPRVNGSLFDNMPKKATEHDNALLKILSGSLQSRFKTILQKSAKGRGCQQLAIIARDQEEISEPMWRAGLSVAKFCVDSAKAIHLISKKYPDYDHDETEKKVESIKGPYTCVKFDEFNPGGCEGCQHKGKIKSPIVLGREVAEAEEVDNVIVEVTPTESDRIVVDPNVIPTFPKPYVRGKNGGVFLRTTDEEGDPVDKVIYHNDLYVMRRVRDPELGESLIMKLHLPKDGVREFVMPLTSATSREEFRKTMAMQGVALMKMDELMSYVTTWVNDLQARGVAEDARRQFGWVEDGGGFVLGDKEYRKDGVNVNHPSSATIQYFPAFQTKGTLDGWREAMRFYNRPGLEMHQFLVASGFGAILMEYIPNINAAGLHLHSPESGFGKTTALYAILSIWGSYEDLVITHQDTRNFSMNRAEVYKNIPVAIDEVTNMDPKALSELAMTVTGGKQRGRMSMSSNVERFRGSRWNTLFITTANTSFIERVSAYKAVPQAEAQRVLEHRVGKYSFDGGKDETDRFNLQLSQNYGHAGPVFVQYVLKNREKVEKLLIEVRRKVDASMKMNHQNRFWSAFISVTLTGGIIAREIGLIDYDIKGLYKKAGELIEENKQSVNYMDRAAVELIGDYIQQNYNNFLRIEGKIDKRMKHGKIDKLQDSHVVPSATPRAEIVGRYEPDTGNMYLITTPLRNWCIDNQVNFKNLCDKAEIELYAVKERIRVTRGTNFSMPPVNVLRINSENFEGILQDDGSEQ